jgi:hypothetical protein
MGVLRCRIGWLLHGDKQVRSCTHLRRLDVLVESWDDKRRVAVTAVQKALRPLQLEVLTLPRLDMLTGPALETALTGPARAAAVSAPPPPLDCWAPSLVELQIGIPLDSGSALLKALSRLQWPSLRTLLICLLTKPGAEPCEAAPEVAQLLQRAVSPQRMPGLQKLQLQSSYLFGEKKWDALSRPHGSPSCRASPPSRPSR